jgi:PAS domain S-box-containing protein
VEQLRPTSGAPPGAPRRWHPGLRLALVALIMAAALPALGFGVAAAIQLGHSQRTSTREGLRNTAQALALALDRELEAGFSALRALAASPLIDSGEYDRLRPQVTAVADAFGGWVVLTDAELRQRLNTLASPDAALSASITGIRAARAALAMGQPVAGELVVGILAQRPTLPLYMPVLRGGKAEGVLILSTALPRLAELISAQSLPNGAFVAILDGSGTVLARTRNPEASLGRALPASAAAVAADPTRLFGRGLTLEGEPAIFAFGRPERAAWTVVVGMTEEAYETAWRGPIERLAIGGLLLLSGAAISAAMLGRRIAAPVRALAQRAEALAAGVPQPPDAPTDMPLAELEALRRALQQAEAATRSRALAEGRAAAAEEASEALRESEARFRAVVEAGPQITWVARPEGGTIYISRRWYDFSGQSPDAPPGTWMSALHPDDRAATELAWQHSLQTGEPFQHEYRFRRRDGSWQWFLGRCLPLRGADGRILRWYGSLTDISEIVAARQALARQGAELERLVSERTAQLAASEARFRAIFDAQFQVIALLAVDGTVLAMNRTALEFGGLQDGTASGRRFWESGWWPTDGEAGPALREAVACAAAGGFARLELEAQGAEGRTALFDLSVKPVRDPVEGTVTLLIAEGRDIAERRRLQARLIQAEKLEALGQLAGGVAHDFNNILQAVAGGAWLIARRPDDPAAVARLARLVIESTERGVSVSRRLLAFARRGELQSRALEVAPLLAGVAEMLRSTLGPAISVELALPAALPRLKADQGQLETALLNLALNARDAMPDGGRLILSAAAEEVAPDAVHPGGTPVAPGAYVRLCVADTGTGMDEATLARAMEPFFTTKPKGRGTGLGLATARGFLEQSGGALAIDSAPGRGTKVTLWLPQVPTTASLTASAPAPPAPPAAPPAAPGAGISVLLVDDEQAVRTVLAMDLAARGFGVQEAVDGAAALAWLEQGGRAKLLVTDLAMPGMTGLELIRRARRLHPGLPSLLVTGHAGEADETAMREAAAGGPFCLLRKPVPAEELAAHALALVEEEEGTPALA